MEEISAPGRLRDSPQLTTNESDLEDILSEVCVSYVPFRYIPVESLIINGNLLLNYWCPCFKIFS